MSEIWKPVLGFEGFYEASSLGRLKSVRSGQILKPHYFKGKYATYNLYDGAGKNHCVRGYRAVFSAFNGPVPEGMELDHIDDNPQNDCLENIQAVTRQENMAKSWRRRRATGYRARNQHTKAGA